MTFWRTIKCPNCGRRTKKGDHCQWCRYPLMLGGPVRKQKAQKAKQEAKATREVEEAAKQKSRQEAKEAKAGAKQEAKATREVEEAAREKAGQEAKEAKARAKQEAKATREVEKAAKQKSRQEAEEAKARAKQEAKARREAGRPAWLKARQEAKARWEAERAPRERERWRRPTVLIITLVLLAASIVGVYRAFTLPTQVEEETTLLSYSHDGQFDYRVYVKPSYLFGTAPLELPAPPEPPEPSPEIEQSNPKYPTEMIDTFKLTFSYSFEPDTPAAEVIQEVEVIAVLEKPEVGSEEIVLVSKTTETGDFTVGFSLDTDDLVSSSSITINAYVVTMANTEPRPIFEDFTQTLTMLSEGSLLEVDRELTSVQPGAVGDVSYEQIGNFDYTIRLKSESIFGAITLEPPTVSPPPLPPPPPPPPPPEILKEGETIFTELVDRMDMTFDYYLESSRPVSQITEQVKIVATLENPGYWSKDFVLVPLTIKQGDFSVSFPLDINQFTDSIRAIEQETGVSGACSLTIRADVSTVAQTDFGPIEEDFSQTLSSTLGGDTLEWTEELVKSEPGSIERSQMIPNTYLGVPVTGARILSAIAAASMLGLFIYFLGLYMKFKPAPPSEIEKEIQLARKKYKELIVDVEELPDIRGEEIMIPLSSLDDLIRTAEELLKPVLHKGERERHTYCAIDGLVRYQYVSQLEPPSEDKPGSDN